MCFKKGLSHVLDSRGDLFLPNFSIWVSFVLISLSILSLLDVLWLDLPLKLEVA